MKVKVIINACVIVMCFVFFSCSQDEEIFSCDKEVNAWVKENLADIRQMTREDWLRLDESVNRATYVAFTPEQKQEFWLQKLQEVLSLEWNELEKSHINVLYQEVQTNPNWFSVDFSINETEFGEFEVFMFKWMDYAEENLRWDKNMISSIVASPNKLLDKTGKIQIKTTSSVRLKSGSEVDCDCNWSTNACALTYKACSHTDVSGCKTKSTGCGLFLQQTCNGLCVR